MSAQTEQLMAAANRAHAAGQLAEAERLTQQALAFEPKDAGANLLMGVLAGKTGRSDVAFRHLKQVLAVQPASFEANFWLSILHRRAQSLAEAISAAQRAVALRPHDAHGLNNLGMCLMEDKQPAPAAEAFRKAVAVRQDMAPIFHNLGTALYLSGRDKEAAEAFEQALRLAPNSVDSLLNLGQVKISQSKPEEAAKLAERALKMTPQAPAAHLLLASALVEDSRTAEAEKHFRRAVELNPNDAQAQALLGQRYQSLGQFTEANEHLSRSLELEPRQGFAYFAYAFNNRMTNADLPMVERMEALAQESRLAPREMNLLYYGLGRAWESLGNFERSMRFYDEANSGAKALKFGAGAFDREAYARKIDDWIERFDKPFLDANRPAGNPSELPVFIVGMMRSGTTLAEQILSSHPKIGAAGEQRFWPAFQAQMSPFRQRNLTQLTKEGAARYIRHLESIAPRNRRITDKMPSNYESLGVIHMALPNARIIHFKRHPVDTCLSIYLTPNRVPVEFAHDRENITFAYEQYLRLMAHWKSVLPADRFLEVKYEDVVENREFEARRMLEFVGMEWNDAVLHHELNQRNVNTPSLWQVRQPIYRSSVDRWLNFEPWLGSFRKLLNVPA